MNHSKLYVPDPNVWINFFKSKSSKKVINQKGGSNVQSAKKSEPMNVELVSPVEAADERTESTIKRLRRKSIRRGQRGKKRINTKKRTKSARRKKPLKAKAKRLTKIKHKPKAKRKSGRSTDIFSR